MGSLVQGTARPAAGADAPNPAPAPSVVKVQMPVDADPDNVANRQAQYQHLVNELAWLKTLQACPPILPASATSGYSAVTASTSPALGGTVTPSGQGSTYHPRSGTNFVVKIILGGAVATATYQISTDGGLTFGATRTTAASLTDIDTGITLAFAGTFNAGGTAQFHSAYTPQLLLADASGNVRSVLADHNGYPGGRSRGEFREEWQFLLNTGQTTNGAVMPGNPKWYTNFTAGGANHATGSPYQNSAAITPFASTSLWIVNNTNAVKNFVYTPINFIPNHTGLVFVMDFEFAPTAIGANSLDWYIGISSAPNDLTSTAGRGVMFRKLHSETNWHGVIYDSVPAQPNVDLGLTPSTSGQRLRLELHMSASPLGVLASANVALFWVNEQLAGVLTDANAIGTALASAGDMGIGFGCVAAAGNSESGAMGAILCSWNRIASVPVI